MANTVDKVIKVAEAEVGYIEKASNKDLESKTANPGKNNYTKYGEWMGMSGTYWCAEYISWIFNKAYGKEAGKKLLCGSFSAACETIRQNFIKAKQYYTSSPKAGDVIFFSGTRHSGANHIGIVYKVDKTYVYTIEGNTSSGTTVIDNGGECAKRKYLLTYNRILGYGRPKYDISSTKTTTSTTTNASTKTTYYPKCDSKYTGIVDALNSIKVDSSKTNRTKIAKANGIAAYSGKAEENSKLLSLLKQEKLVKP